jgi:hypothetical protein
MKTYFLEKRRQIKDSDVFPQWLRSLPVHVSPRIMLVAIMLPDGCSKIDNPKGVVLDKR